MHVKELSVEVLVLWMLFYWRGGEAEAGLWLCLL